MQSESASDTKQSDDGLQSDNLSRNESDQSSRGALNLFKFNIQQHVCTSSECNNKVRN